MEFPKDSYDPKTLDLMQWAFDTAWEEVEYTLAGSEIDRTGLRTIMSVRIMAAVRDGERDPESLRELALEAIAEVY